MGRTRVVESTEPISVRVPLFVLGTPTTAGCKAEWTNDIVSGISRGWTLQIAGSGFTSDRGSTYVSSASFAASSGETKLIFCDVELRLENIEICEPGKAPINEWRIDLTTVSRKPEVGIRLLDPDAVPSRGAFVRKFSLAEDPTAAPANFREEYRQAEAKKITVGLSVKGVQLGLSASSNFESSVAITYTLRGGTDYELFEAADCEGWLF
jgi:hypothetical protein